MSSILYVSSIIAAKNVIKDSCKPPSEVCDLCYTSREIYVGKIYQFDIYPIELFFVKCKVKKGTVVTSKN